MHEHLAKGALAVACLIPAFCLPLAASALDDSGLGTRQVVEETINASVDEVWAAWTTKAGLQTWMAPIVEVDFRVGGTFQTNYNPQEKIGAPGTIENTIIAYDPKRMLSIKVTKAPAGFPFPNAIKNVWTIIYFSEVSPSSTNVTIVTVGYTDTEESRKMRQFFAAGNAHTLKSLKASLER